MIISKLSDLPAEHHCNQCDKTKPIAEMLMVRTKGRIELRPRCKECHNAREAGYRREYKRNYLRAWRKRNKPIDKSYRDTDTYRAANARRARRYVSENKEALAIKRRLKTHGVLVTLAEATELLQQYGRCYPTKYGLTPGGLKECERIRSTQRRRGARHPLTPFQIRVMVYEDGHFITPENQPTPYQKAAATLRDFRARQLEQKTAKVLPASQSCATLRATSVAATA